MRRARIVNAGRAAGENQTLRLKLVHTFGCDVVPDNLAKNVLLAHSPRNKLAVLRAKIDDQNAFAFRSRVRLIHFDFCPLPNSTDRRVAASTASMSAALNPPRSRACKPAIVVPPGLATMSLSVAGWEPVSKTI